MKLLIFLLAIGAVLGAQEFVDGEYFLGLKQEIDHDDYLKNILPTFNLKLLKVFHMSHAKLVLVAGEEADVIRASKLSGVKFWERNKIVHTQQCASGSAAGCWGLDRIDQRADLSYILPISPGAVYDWGRSDGAGVNVYIVDSGIDVNHLDFGGRAVWGFTAGDYTETDETGHGTHVAGTVGSNSYGVAKSSSLVAVRVLDAFGSGSTDDVVAGLQYVEEQHGTGDKSVINMSIGGSGTNSAMNAAVRSCIADGITVVVAAGNSNDDACLHSPGQVVEAITVGASDVNDESAYFTNFGICIDLFAPGVSVLSTFPSQGTEVEDGTSMSSPHVSGAAARYMSSLSSAPSPANVASWLTSQATNGTLTWWSNPHSASPNLLTYVGGLC